jgi:flagellar protein FlaG
VLTGTRQSLSAQPERPALSAANVPTAPSAALAASPAEVQRAVETINAQLQQAAKGYEGTGKTVVRVFEVETGEVIRQIPSEEVLAISRSIEKLQGLLFDQEI